MGAIVTVILVIVVFVYENWAEKNGPRTDTFKGD